MTSMSFSTTLMCFLHIAGARSIHGFSCACKISGMHHSCLCVKPLSFAKPCLPPMSRRVRPILKLNTWRQKDTCLPLCLLWCILMFCAHPAWQVASQNHLGVGWCFSEFQPAAASGRNIWVRVLWLPTCSIRAKGKGVAWQAYLHLLLCRLEVQALSRTFFYRSFLVCVSPCHCKTIVEGCLLIVWLKNFLPSSCRDLLVPQGCGRLGKARGRWCKRIHETRIPLICRRSTHTRA
mmetsp:Transcript_22847/g.63143  ORF Transcript_22847/g.63143 Transcript_22847/m.63143 type:complete len:235 (-) Transcript_22847:103-807(-)